MEKIHTYDKILSPIVTEKSTSLSEQNKIVFKVPNKSNKSKNTYKQNTPPQKNNNTTKTTLTKNTTNTNTHTHTKTKQMPWYHV